MKKLKHDHKGTKILKLGIFASLMLAPLMAISFKCAYVTFNKNAKDSYYGETINEEKEITINYTDLVVNETYYFRNTINSDLTNEYGNANKIFVSDVTNINGFNNNVDLSATDYIRLYINNTYNAVQFFDNSNNQVATFNMFALIGEFSFKYLGFTNNDNIGVLSYYNYFYQIEHVKYSYLDNAFYYAIDQAMDSQYFAWARTSALYTPTSTMTQGIGINTNAVPTLLVYWLILTAVYVIVDIVIEIFTYLTHMITSRLEE